MINLIHADSGKEISIDHRKITNIREFKGKECGFFCILSIYIDNDNHLGLLPVRGTWADIKSKIEKDIGREMTIEEWGEYCPDSIVHVTFHAVHTDESKTKNGDEMFHVEQ